MIRPRQKDDELIRDILSTRDAQDDRFHLWWLGQSGFLLQYRGQHVLFDPYLSDSLTKKYADTDKPHIRMSERAVDPHRLDFISVVTSSHNHTDHLDGDTLRPLIRANPSLKMIIPEANREFVCNRLQCHAGYPIGLDEGTSVEIAPFTFHGIPAAHNELDRDEEGHCRYLGYVAEFGPWAVYHSGDTLWREEIIEHLKDFDTDLAILPINGNKPERRVAGNLNAREAVALAQTTGAKHVIPCHYDMFSFNTADPLEFAREAKRAGQPYSILEIGAHWHSGHLGRRD